MPIDLRNPHSVLAALEMRPKEVLKVFAPRGGDVKGQRESAEYEDGWQKIIDVAKKNSISVESAKGLFGKGDRQGDAQGRVGSAGGASVKEKQPIALESLFEHSKNQGQPYGVWIALDQVQDPQNVGAIFRLAGFFGIRGVVLTETRSAGLTSTVYDVACGGVEYVPHSTHPSLRHVIDVAKDKDLWVLGTSEHTKQHLSSISLDRNWLILFGNEERGIRRLSADLCDVLVGIAPKGRVTSLNVSTASAVVLSHLLT